ncbi:methyl-accepting chemotaxis protein [Gluconacetobacter aggeris]|uniref:Methyl-accepting chemotaxis protein n=2 Tax=Gluconacetobacter aggeris TaxID=1286186 RepID=A0A7W4NWQ4_9PROT|nr:methyl-accepting chemotaxis protein [Gluconacetobacter aggeris]
MVASSHARPRASLSTKIIMICGLSFIIIQLVAVALSSRLMKAQVEKTIYSEAISNSQILAQKITLALTAQNTVVRGIQGTIETAHRSGVLTRQFIVDLLYEDMQRFPDIYGMDFKEVPRGFDGTQVPGGPGTNSHGIFFPYVLRGADGKVTINTPPEHYSDVYRNIIKTGDLDGLEPYIDADTKVPMVSPTYPITFDGKRIAVIGADIPLGWLAPLLKNVRIAEGSTISLLSSQGFWIVNPDPALVMKHYNDTPNTLVEKAIAEHKLSIIRNFNNGTVDRIVVPLKIDNFNVYWTLIVDVPSEAITRPVWDNIFSLVIPGVTLIILSVALMWLIFNKLLSTPLRNLLQSVSALEHGDYDVTVYGVQRSDELGATARGLENFRGSLLRARQADAEAEQERRRNEAQQARRRQEDEQRLKDVNRVIDTIGTALNALSTGDLSSQIQQPLPQEFEPLRTNFNRSIQQLATAITGISNAVDTIRKGSQTVSTGAEELADRTEQQAAALEETTAAINQITRNVSHAEDVINNTQAIGVQACDSAESSSEIMSRTRQAMQRIETSSAQVVAIVEVIDGVAFQTNVLALNASIEAARAGDAGKGFAVVANEVRVLAQRCTDAARDIGDLVRKTVEEIHTGATCVRDTEKALQTISGLVSTMGEKLNAIVHSARDQATSLKEVSAAVTVMDQSTQKNASIADTSRSSARSLAGETQKLTQLVTHFRLPGSRNTASRDLARHGS